MKKAFVTGATDFIGLNQTKRLLDNRWEVTALHLPGENLKYLSRFAATPVAGNILDYPDRKKAVLTRLSERLSLCKPMNSLKKRSEAKLHSY